MKRVILLIFMLVFLIGNTVYAEGERWFHPKYIRTYIQPYHPNTIMMQHAFQRWTKVTNKKVIFIFNTNRKAADIEVCFVDKIGQKHDNDKAIGLAEIKSISGTKIKHVTIWIADKTNDNRILDKDEVFTTMLHEIGHAIGLEHSSDPESVMCPFNDVVQEISNDDIQRVLDLYK